MLRVKRNKLLEETDKTQLPDFPLDAKNKTLYREYRSYLRNLPSMYNDTNIDKFKIKTFDEWREFRRNGDY